MVRRFAREAKVLLVVKFGSTSRPATSSDLPHLLKRVSRKELPLFASLVWNQRAFELHTAVLPLTDFPVSFLGSGRAVPFHRHQQRMLHASHAYGQLGHLLEGKEKQ